MGYIVQPFAVDLGKVRAAIGSKNKSLLSKLKKKFAEDFEQFDEMLADTLEEDEEDASAEPLTMVDVLRHLIMGEPYRENIGFAYGYGFEFLCQHFGDFLDNGEWSAMRAEWFDTVQKALKKAGVSEKALSFNQLVFRGPPVELPEIDDSPCIGYLTKAEIAKARAALTAADLSKVKNTDAVASIEQIISWLDTCAKKKCDLVCTYA